MSTSLTVFTAHKANDVTSYTGEPCTLTGEESIESNHTTMISRVFDIKPVFNIQLTFLITWQHLNQMGPVTRTHKKELS